MLDFDFIFTNILYNNTVFKKFKNSFELYDKVYGFGKANIFLTLLPALEQRE